MLNDTTVSYKIVYKIYNPVYSNNKLQGKMRGGDIYENTWVS